MLPISQGVFKLESALCERTIHDAPAASCYLIPDAGSPCCNR